MTLIDDCEHALDSTEGGVAPARTSGVTRRSILQRSVAGGLGLSMMALLDACSSSTSTTTATRTAGSTMSNSVIPSPDAFVPSAGTAIPQTTVGFAMWPYGDTTIGFIGIREGYFDDVGIQVSPKAGQTLTETQTANELLNGQIDIGSGYMPLAIEDYVHMKQLKLTMFTDTYIGNYVLASPKLGDKTLAQFQAQGQSFDAAIKSVVSQMRGKTVGLSNTGDNRTFFETVLSLGGLSPSAVKLQVLSDDAIVEAGKAGTLDYCFPTGAAQSVELLDAGFVRLAGATDFINGLPVGNATAVNSIGHAGLAASIDYVTKNLETVLRFNSVMYRIINEIQTSPAILKTSLDVLNSAAGVTLSLKDAETIFKEFYGIIGFNQQAEHLINPGSRYYYETVYKPQIAASVKGGVIPASAGVTPDDVTVAKPLYLLALDLKNKYEHLKSTQNPTGKLADQAAIQYERFNFLDAYRLLKAA